MAASGSLARAVFSISIRETESVPYQPISPAELADLKREVGRPLSEEQAQKFRIRKLKERLIADMLNQTGGAK